MFGYTPENGITMVAPAKTVRRIPVWKSIDIKYEPSELTQDSFRLVDYIGGVYTKELKIAGRKKVTVLWNREEDYEY